MESRSGTACSQCHRKREAVEDRNFEIRKHLLDYDDVLNEQRNFIYAERDAILSDEHLLQRVRAICHEISASIVDAVFAESKNDQKGSKILSEMLTTFQLSVPLLDEKATGEEYKTHLVQCIDAEIDAKVALTGEKPFNDFLRFNYLRQVDLRWQDHLTALEDLRDAVGLRSYAQRIHWWSKVEVLKSSTRCSKASSISWLDVGAGADHQTSNLPEQSNKAK